MILCFMLDFPFDLSIIHAYPDIFAFDLATNLAHSRIDLPVVITSSTNKTFKFFYIEKFLLRTNLPFTLSEKIVSFFKILPISYPIIRPPLAGDKIKSIFFY